MNVFHYTAVFFIFPLSILCLDSSVECQSIPSLKDQNLVPLVSEFTGYVVVEPELVATFWNFGACMKTMRFNKGCTKIIGVSQQGVMSIWDIQEKRRLREFPLGLRYLDAAFDKDDESIVTKVNADTLLLWKKHNGRYQYTRKIKGSLPDVDENPFITLSYKGKDNAVHFVDRETMHCKMVLPAHNSTIEFARLNRDGNLLITTGCDRKIHVWRVGKTPAEIMEEVSLWCKIKKIIGLS